MPTQFKVGHCPIGDMHASRDKIVYTAFKFESVEGYDKQMLKVCINIYIYIYCTRCHEQQGFQDVVRALFSPYPNASE